MRFASATCVALATLLVVAGCAPPAKDQSKDGSTSSKGVVATSTPTGEKGPAGFESYYSQRVSWSSCDGFQCASVKAPVSWSDKDAGSIELALKRQPAKSGKSKGSLLINPGGPGASGVDFLTSAVGADGQQAAISSRVQAQYDIVGFDPRGVQRSSPVECLDGKQLDAYLAADYSDDAAGLAKQRKEAASFASACQKNTGPVLGHVDTQSAARDMDMLRAVLGNQKLTYLGYSYGTDLGYTYAELFPSKVGKLVLDGAIDPTLTPDESTEQQAIGFENALRAYVKDCLAGSNCPLSGSVDDGLHQISDLLDKAERHPLPTASDRRVTGTLAFTGIAVTLYSNQSWPVLTQALTQAMDQGRGDQLLRLADIYNDRNADGTYSSNETAAFTAVNCLDGPQSSDPTEMKDQADRLAKEAPTVAKYFSYGGITCEDWPYKEVAKAADPHATGAAPIVVIGTTGDPATPYSGAQHMAKELDSGVLVTYQGEGHTAYGRSNSCITNAVDDYFLQGAVPKDGLMC